MTYAQVQYLYEYRTGTTCTVPVLVPVMNAAPKKHLCEAAIGNRPLVLYRYCTGTSTGTASVQYKYYCRPSDWRIQLDREASHCIRSCLAWLDWLCLCVSARVFKPGFPVGIKP